MASYSDWNEAFCSHFFGPESSGPVYLALDDDAIEDLWLKTPSLSGGGTAGAVGGVDDLSRAVRDDIRARGWLPEPAADCLARCCLFVLAYSRVAHRERPGAPAYWKHVRRLLDPSDAVAGGHLGPLGLDQPTFQELWARTRYEFRLELPRPSATDERRWRGQLCNVDIVRSQAGLRQLDLSHVRAVFGECRGKRGLAKSASEEEIAAWITERKDHLTSYAQRVLARNPEVARRQILGEWQRHLSASTKPASTIDQTSETAWQGQSPRKGASPLYLQLDVGRGLLVAYRGDALVGAEQLASELRRFRDRVWTFDELYERFQASRSAASGGRIILFVEEQRLPAELAALTELSGSLRSWRPADLNGLPAGWALVQCREIRRPRLTHAFSWILPALELRGGLTIEPGRWLVGAGPLVQVETATEIEVDDEAWPVADGRVDLSALAPGPHEVRCGGRVERLEIVPGRRVTDVGDASRWVWPSGSGWPELTASGAAARRSLDGPLFVDEPSRLDTGSATGASRLDFAFACRRRPTVEDVERALAGRRGKTLALAAVARGRA